MPRNTPLALKNLTHQPRRTLVSVLGVMLAVVLMFMQLGFLGAVGDTATVVYQKMPMDIVVRSPDYLHLLEPDSVDESLVYSLMSLPEVAEIRPLDATIAPWLNPNNFEARGIATLGIDPPRPGVVTAELLGKVRRLTSPEFVLVDRTSGSEFGPAEGGVFGAADVGRATEVNGRRVRVVGTFHMGTGLAAAGAMVTSREGFQRLAPGGHSGRASLLLVRLKPAVELEQGRQAIRHKLARLDLESLQVLTRNEALWRERLRWYSETPIGLIFALGVALAVVVGGVICYMVLAAEVLANLREYATLKAMGYSNRYLSRTLVEQAVLLSVAAYLPALALSWTLYGVVSELADIPIRMTGERVVMVAALSISMCIAAGLIALRKLTKAEPASLF